MEIAGIKAGEKEKIYINDEAAAKFKVKFTDSRTIESNEIYFTGGVNITVDIYDNRIDLKNKVKRPFGF